MPGMRVRLLVFAGGGCAALALGMALLAAEPSAPSVRQASALHPVTVRQPAGPPRVQTGAVNHDGTPATIACSTCHAVRPPNPANAASGDLDLFHQGLHVAHGANTCLSCHDAGDYDSLHLANGTRLPFTEVMQLCGQCHGPQLRDWNHGVHGGMSGHWDLTRGGRTRLGCTDCHDPHAPTYQGAIPMPPPRDRFQTRGGHHE
jgi:hypothetical protein